MHIIRIRLLPPLLGHLDQLLRNLNVGLFMSDDAGVSWKKQSDAVSGGTGPHYYQELYASPHQEARLYLMSNVSQISDDHGKNFRFMNEDKNTRRARPGHSTKYKKTTFIRYCG